MSGRCPIHIHNMFVADYLGGLALAGSVEDLLLILLVLLPNDEYCLVPLPGVVDGVLKQ